MSTEIAKAGGSLAIRSDQIMWSPQQEAVLRQSGISDQVTKAELAGFLHLCQRTGLDPFSRQIYLIGRWNKKAGREVFTPQTGIDGYRVIAQRVTAQDGGTYGYEDTLWCDSSGQWRDVWLADEPPAAAKVTVVRNGQRFSAVARFSEYAQTFNDGNLMGLWAKMPAGQIAKCTEALALRKAFPHDLAGVYTAEEMAQADNPEPQPHLRSVPAGQSDQWETAAPAAQRTPPDVVAAGVADLPPESVTPAGRDYLHEAMKAPDVATIKQIYADAKTEGARPEYLAQIAQVGIAKEKAATEQQTTTSPVVTGQVVSAQEQAEAAEQELRTFAQQVGLPTIEADFEIAKGVPLAVATAEQIRGFLTELRGSAA